MPKLKITHTSDDRDGQIYVAAVNWILMLLTVAVTAGFQANPVSLALAYGERAAPCVSPHCRAGAAAYLALQSHRERPAGACWCMRPQG